MENSLQELCCLYPLSYDHRIIDGAEAVELNNEVKRKFRKNFTLN